MYRNANKPIIEIRAKGIVVAVLIVRVLIVIVIARTGKSVAGVCFWLFGSLRLLARVTRGRLGADGRGYYLLLWLLLR